MTDYQDRVAPFSLRRFLAVLLVTASLCGCSKPVTVSVVEAENHRLEVSFTERAETTLRQEYPVSMPVNGKVGRIDLEVGDHVRQGEVLATIDVTPALQEVQARQAGVEANKARQQISADTSVERAEYARALKNKQAAQAQMGSLGPALKAAQVAVDNAQRELTRVNNLVARGALPSRDAESARLALEQAQAALAAKKSEAQVLRSQLAEAQAAVNAAAARVDLKSSEARSQTALVEEAQARKEQAQYTLEQSRVLSPIDGLVLSRIERGPKELPAGSPLLVLGKPSDLEAVCDVLSQDALRLSRGTHVLLDAGDAYPDKLRGEVRLVEPQGFTKRSSLGVEQQRVKVRISLLDPPKSLGTGYELWARFLLTEKTALALPRSCFVRFGEEFRVWKVAGGKLSQVPVEIGLKGDNHWEVLGKAVAAGDQIVKSPTDDLQAGVEVTIATP